MRKYKSIMACFYLLLGGVTYWAIAGLETEMQQRHEILPDDELQTVGSISGLPMRRPDRRKRRFFAEHGCSGTVSGPRK